MTVIRVFVDWCEDYHFRLFHRGCPACFTSEVKVYDRGLKRYLRKLVFNNRFYCFKCRITWRAQSPMSYQRMHHCK